MADFSMIIAACGKSDMLYSPADYLDHENMKP
jgi:hypothetical protein